MAQTNHNNVSNPLQGNHLHSLGEGAGAGLRIVISGGGTGGHIFPAISIANAVRELEPTAKILFVGAEGRMEMQRVPQAGYDIEGLPIRGFYRPLWKPANIGVAIDYLKSKRRAKKILRRFKPQVAVGVGGYASSAALGAANSMGIPTLLQEQNSYAGLANKTLAKQASKICVAYEGMERFFPQEKLLLTGNPVRQSLLSTTVSREEALRQFGLDTAKKTVLIVGGSLGARTINESVLQNLDAIAASDVQFIWQTGKYYSEEIANRLKTAMENSHLSPQSHRLHHRHGSRLSCSRPRHQPCRSRLHQRVLPVGKARDTRAQPKRCRGSSDEERHGTRQPPGRPLREGQRRTGTAAAAGSRHCGRRRTPALAQREHP